MSGEPRARVLLVDDEPRILSSLMRALRREGYELHSAESPQQALRLVEEQDFDCVMSDYRMGGLTGLQLLERVAERCPRTALLLITGWNEEIPPGELERVGVRAVLGKPWDDAELKATLRDATSGEARSPLGG